MKKKFILIASILSFAVFVTPRANAQWVQTKGPTGNGALVQCLAVSGTTLFAGTEGSGVSLSTNDGASWAWNASTGAYVTSFTLIGTNLFAGTASGVFLSTDDGGSWTHAGLDSDGIRTLAVSGTNLFAVADYYVYLSTDTGKSWAPVNNSLFGNFGKSFGDVLAIAVSGMNLFAEIEYGGVYLSTDNGTNWVYDTSGMGKVDVNAITVSGTNLFAGTGASVFLSTNNGTNWTGASTGLPANSFVWSFGVSGTNVFAGIEGGGIFLSTDNGTSWTPVDSDLTGITINSFAIIGTNLFAGSDGAGVWVRPLSEMISTSGVSEPQTSSPEIQSYPNPFSQSTTISFSSPDDGMAEVTIFNLLGSEVTRIFLGELEAGEHNLAWNASGMAPGMYECIVNVNGRAERVPIMIAR